MSKGLLWIRSSLLITMLHLTTCAGLALAQFAPPQQEIQRTPEELAAEEFFKRVPRDPRLTGLLSELRLQIQAGEVTEALEVLQQVNDLQVDFFLHEEGLEITSTLRTRIDEILREYQVEYERLIGSQAKTLLTEAIQRKDVDGLLTLVQQYEFSNAGAQALDHLARLHAMSGEPGISARLYERLHDHPQPTFPREVVLEQAIRAWHSAGQIDSAVQLIRKHREEFNRKLAQDQRPLVIEGQESDWLQQNFSSDQAAGSIVPVPSWRTPYGGLVQSANATPATALFLDKWMVPLVDEYDFPAGAGDPDVLKKAANRETMVRQRNDVLAFPAAVPLIVKGTVIANRYGGVRAYDLATGELKWPGVVVEATFHDMFVSDYASTEPPGEVNTELEDLFFTQRGWRDATANSITADDQTVYCLVDCNLYGAISPNLAQSSLIRSSRLPDRQNMLLAYELDTGRLKNWAVSHANFGNADEVLPGQRGAYSEIFFYSAPLPVHGRLFCLGEERGQTQLYELDPETGVVRWALPLMNPQEDLVSNETRRLSGLMPSYRDGLLICPLSENMLTAVDIVQRRLVWTKMYSRVLSSRGQSPNAGMMMARSRSRTASQTAEKFLTEDRWLDNRLIVTAGKLLYAPPESRSLVCLNVSDGSEVWNEILPLVDGVYPVGIQGDNLIIVDQHAVLAVQLANGRPAWKQSVPIPVPSGRGVIMNQTLVQPTLAGSIVYVDLAAGQFLAEVPLADGFIAGNLSVAEGTVVTQTGTQLAAFLNIEETSERIARQLEGSEQRAAALFSRGLLRLSQKDLQPGIADLRESFRLDPRAETRTNLMNSLLAGLRADFAAGQEYLPELERLVDSPEKKRELLRVKALGLASIDRVESFRNLLALLSSLPSPVPMIQEQQSLTLREDLWLLGQLRELLAAATEDEKLQIHAAWHDWLFTEFEANPAATIGLLRLLPDHWIPVDIVQKLIPYVEEQQAPEFVSMTCQTLLTHSDPVVKLESLLALARLAAGRTDVPSTRHWIAELPRLIPSLPANAQSSAQERLSTLQIQAGIQELLARDIAWPQEWIVGESTNHVVQQSPLIPIPVYGKVSPELQGWTFTIESSGSFIHVRNADGVLSRSLNTHLAGSVLPMDPPSVPWPLIMSSPLEVAPVSCWQTDS